MHDGRFESREEAKYNHNLEFSCHNVSITLQNDMADCCEILYAYLVGPNIACSFFPYPCIIIFHSYAMICNEGGVLIFSNRWGADG